MRRSRRTRPTRGRTCWSCQATRSMPTRSRRRSRLGSTAHRGRPCRDRRVGDLRAPCPPWPAAKPRAKRSGSRRARWPTTSGHRRVLRAVPARVVGPPVARRAPDLGGGPAGPRRRRLAWMRRAGTTCATPAGCSGQPCPRFGALLATVPSLMILDDHEVTDDWNLDHDVGDGRLRQARGPAGSWPTGSSRTSLFQHLGQRAGTGSRPAARPRRRSSRGRAFAAGATPDTARDARPAGRAGRGAASPTDRAAGPQRGRARCATT